MKKQTIKIDFDRERFETQIIENDDIIEVYLNFPYSQISIKALSNFEKFLRQKLSLNESDYRCCLNSFQYDSNKFHSIAVIHFSKVPQLIMN